MYPLLNQCPVCSGEMVATTLSCRECDTTIHGRFFTGPFGQLNQEQIEFIEIFVKNQGKITRVEAELGLSYPTIRNRLYDVIRAMGYDPGGDEPLGLSEEERHQILDDLSQGKIEYDEAMRLLKESEANQ
ncbi:MAG: DUF2089 domain-containing protein [Anaerolineae bacterium]|nr:DUF2089 domain-containing protein [Anaerolineae bacterium]